MQTLKQKQKSSKKKQHLEFQKFCQIMTRVRVSRNIHTRVKSLRCVNQSSIAHGEIVSKILFENSLAMTAS